MKNKQTNQHGDQKPNQKIASNKQDSLLYKILDQVTKYKNIIATCRQINGRIWDIDPNKLLSMDRIEESKSYLMTTRNSNYATPT